MFYHSWILHSNFYLNFYNDDIVINFTIFSFFIFTDTSCDNKISDDINIKEEYITHHYKTHSFLPSLQTKTEQSLQYKMTGIQSWEPYLNILHIIIKQKVYCLSA